MNIHHKFSKAQPLSCDRHTYRVDTTIEYNGRQYKNTMFTRAGTPENVLKACMGLAKLNEEMLMDKINAESFSLSHTG